MNSHVAYVCGLILGTLGAIVTQDPPPLPNNPPTVVQDLRVPPTFGNYRILPIRAIDGDTIDFFWLIPDRARIYGIQAPETRGPTEPAGVASREHLRKILPTIPITARVHGREKFGRALLQIYDVDNKEIATRLVEAGHAVRWDGKGPRP